MTGQLSDTIWESSWLGSLYTQSSQKIAHALPTLGNDLCLTLGQSGIDKSAADGASLVAVLFNETKEQFTCI